MGLINRIEKVHRDAILYLDPKRPLDHTFAQCVSCMMWSGPASNVCSIHGPNVRVTADMVCGFYIHGKPNPENAEHAEPLVTPKESGLYKGAVRCENCQSLDSEEKICLLFQTLTTRWPETFDLDENVHPQGCCNAWRPK